MACGCSKGGGGGASYRSRPMLRPTGNVRGIQGSVTAAMNPAQTNNSMTPAPVRNSGGVTSEQRKTQALRRDAIRRALNK
jgi:hypothetical protein